MNERGFVTYHGSLYMAFGLMLLAGLLALINMALSSLVPAVVTVALLRVCQLLALGAACCAAWFGGLVLQHLWNLATGKYK